MEHHAAHQLVKHRGTPHVCPAEVFLRTEAQIGERLGFADVIAFRRTLRNRFFRCRHNQLAVAAIQNEDVAGFRRGVNHRNGFTVYGNVRQRRLGRHIHIPQIVVNGLVAPGQLTGGRVQCHDSAGITFLLRRAVTAPDIWRSNAHRQVDQVQLRVIRRRRPGVWRVKGKGVFVRRDRVRIFRARVEGPQQFTGVHVETTDNAGGFAGGEVICYRTGNHDGFIGDDGRGGRLIQTRRGVRHIGLQIQDTFVGKGFAQLARFGIDGEQTTIVHRQHDAARTVGNDFRARIIRARFVIRDATAGHVLEGRVGVQLRIEVPFLFTGGRVEREQTLMRRTQIKHIADFNWRHFVGQFTRIVRHLQIAGTEHPGFFQVFNVVRVDLLQRRVALTFLVAAIGRPVAVSNLRDRRRRRRFCVQRTVDLLRIVEASPGQDTAAD